MTDSKTATEIQRELLDERGVEHEDRWSGDITYTKWQGIGGMWFSAQDCFCNGQLLYIQGRNMTPEQAIAATLGSDEYQRGYDDGLHANTKAAFAAARRIVQDAVGECEVEDPDGMRMCSHCHYYIGEHYRYCAHCGKKVKR